MTSRTPTRLKVLGVLFLVVAVPNVLSPLFEAYGQTAGDTAWQVGGGVALGVVGLGLLYDGRWAWGGALTLGLAMVVGGVFEMTGPGDITNPGGAVVGAYLVITGVLVLGLLLSPRSFRWFRGRIPGTP
jgi:hypothetical protein